MCAESLLPPPRAAGPVRGGCAQKRYVMARIAGGAGNVLARPHAHTGVGGLIGETAGCCAQVGVVAVDLVVELRLGTPAVVKRVLQRGRAGAGVLVPMAPACAVVEVAWHPVEFALRVEQRNAAPGRSLAAVVLRVCAQGQQRARARPLTRRRTHRRTRRFGAGSGPGGSCRLGRRPRRVPAAAAFVDGAAQVQEAAVLAPAARAGHHVPLKVARGLLAHPVDGGTRRAAARGWPVPQRTGLRPSVCLTDGVAKH